MRARVTVLLAALAAAGCIDFPLDEWQRDLRYRRRPAVVRPDTPPGKPPEIPEEAERKREVVYVPFGPSTFTYYEGYYPYYYPYSYPAYGGLGFVYYGDGYYGGYPGAHYGAYGYPYGYAGGFPSGALGLGYGVYGGFGLRGSRYRGGYRGGTGLPRESYGIYGRGSARQRGSSPPSRFSHYR